MGPRTLSRGPGSRRVWRSWEDLFAGPVCELDRHSLKPSYSRFGSTITNTVEPPRVAEYAHLDRHRACDPYFWGVRICAALGVIGLVPGWAARSARPSAAASSVAI